MRLSLSPRRPRRAGGAIARASAAAAASLDRARDDHAREREAAGQDARLAQSLRDIRAENHFADIIAAAFRGD